MKWMHAWTDGRMHAWIKFIELRTDKLTSFDALEESIFFTAESSPETASEYNWNEHSIFNKGQSSA